MTAKNVSMCQNKHKYNFTDLKTFSYYQFFVVGNYNFSQIISHEKDIC